MLVVAYFGEAPPDESCYACDEAAQFTILAVNGVIRDFACTEHVAEHMLSNAVALGGEELLTKAVAS